MDDTIKSQNISQEIGTILRGLVTEPYEKIIAEADFSKEGVIDGISKYVLADGTEKSFPASQVNWKFKELRDVVQKDGQKWNKVRYELTKDGQFTTDFEY